jgi:hypothetical protein
MLYRGNVRENGHVWTIFAKMFCEYREFSRNNFFSIFAKMEKGISVSNLVLVNEYILYQVRHSKNKVVETGRIGVFFKIYPQNKN